MDNPLANSKLTRSRHSIRLKGYDYSQAGLYFVTICVQGRECLLGEIVDSDVHLSDSGQIAAESWLWLEEHYPFVTLDEWVIMPNHMHGIIMITDEPCRGGSRTAPTKRTTPAKRISPTRRTEPTTGVERKPLGRLIGAFKTVSTKKINELRGTPGTRFWQRNYYEHIIRNDRELNAIRAYIRDNPANWQRDRENRPGLQM